MSVDIRGPVLGFSESTESQRVKIPGLRFYW